LSRYQDKSKGWCKSSGRADERYEEMKPHLALLALVQRKERMPKNALTLNTCREPISAHSKLKARTFLPSLHLLPKNVGGHKGGMKNLNLLRSGFSSGLVHGHTQWFWNTYVFQRK
jgi:hypothetical protein